MSVTETRYDFSVKLAPVAQGDAYVTDHGLAWWDRVEKSFPYGSGDYDANGFPYLEAVERVGVLARPFVVLKDTLRAHWAFTGSGEWDERSSTAGAPGVKRLMQYKSEAGVSYLAICNFTHPEDPGFALSLIIPPSPRTWDYANAKPYVRMEFGNGQWAIHFEESGGYLCRWWKGQWVVVGELDSPNLGAAYKQVDEIWVFVRCVAGQILVSTNFGRSYKKFANPDESYFGVQSGKTRIRGRGGQVVFGIHELFYYNSKHYDSPQINTFTSRVLAFPTFDASRFYAPTGTGITFTDHSDAFNGLAGYRATFTTTSVARTNLNYHYTPVLKATVMNLPVLKSSFLPEYETPWDGKCYFCKVTKPFELHSGTATWRVDFNPGDTLEENYRLRKVQIDYHRKTYVDDALTDMESWTVFTGYITGHTISDGGGYGEAYVEFKAGTVAVRLLRTEWTFQDLIPLGGNGCGTAADYVLYTEGLTAADRSWWEPLSTNWLLPPGLIEEPFLMLKRKEKKWHTLTEIFSYPQLELGVLDNGVLVTVPKNYYTGISHNMNGREITDRVDYTDSIKSVSHTVNYLESTTCCLTYAKALDGTNFMAFIVDIEAEQNPASVRFSPQREVHQEEVGYPTEVGPVIGRTLDAAYDMLAKKREPELTCPINMDIGRRDFIIPHGLTNLGLEDDAHYWVMTTDHTMEMDRKTGSTSLTTAAGVRKVEGLYA